MGDAPLKSMENLVKFNNMMYLAHNIDKHQLLGERDPSYPPVMTTHYRDLLWEVYHHLKENNHRHYLLANHDVTDPDEIMRIIHDELRVVEEFFVRRGEDPDLLHSLGPKGDVVWRDPNDDCDPVLPLNPYTLLEILIPYLGKEANKVFKIYMEHSEPLELAQRKVTAAPAIDHLPFDLMELIGQSFHPAPRYTQKHYDDAVTKSSERFQSVLSQNVRDIHEYKHGIADERRSKCPRIAAGSRKKPHTHKRRKGTHKRGKGTSKRKSTEKRNRNRKRNRNKKQETWVD
jgi:hypothetical protein